jgi:two-component system phosphate regulon sensor histidine kinase PhoR
MAIKFRRTYRFAFRTSLYITLILSASSLLFQVYLAQFSLAYTFAQGCIVFLASFFVIQFRVEKFIYKRIKKIYDQVSLLESTSIDSQPITTDMATLTKEVSKFASDKKLEIEALKIRENYRKDFIGNISHELKTPLFTVQGYILTLLSGNVKEKKIIQKYLKRANLGVERLIYIVNDLDMITKLETGNLNLYKESFDIVELIQNVMELLEMKAVKSQITLTFDTTYNEPIMVYADMERIKQVVTNLIVNSIKYGKKDGTTEISIESLTQHKILVRVTDNGEGIKKEHIPRLFERFYRVDQSGSREEGGSGLGLSIVKHIVEAHGEKIYVESEFGVGSEFSFTLEKVKKSAKVFRTTAASESAE